MYVTLLVVVCCKLIFGEKKKRDLGNSDWFYVSSPLTDHGLCWSDSADVVWRCKTKESSQNSVSSMRCVNRQLERGP